MSRKKAWNTERTLWRGEWDAYNGPPEDAPYLTRNQYVGDLRQALESVRLALTMVDPYAPSFAKFLHAARNLSHTAYDPGRSWEKVPIQVDREAWNAFCKALAELRRR